MELNTKATARLIAFFLSTFFTLQLWAADPDIFATKKGAIRGVDPVAYFDLEPGEKAVRGLDEFTYQHQGALWKFASAENRDAFAANPEKYTPQYGGYCAFAVSHGFTKPINVDAWKIVDGKLYLNLSKRVKRKWEKDQTAAITRADNNWQTALQACEAHNNCRS